MLHPLLRAAAAACLVVSAPAAWAGPPDAAKLRLASEQYDLGANAFKKKEYEQAASHFEAADAAVPSAKALRLAIRARSEAGQGSRAATLAALALARHPGDADTAKVAQETIEKTEALLHKVSIACVSPCVLAVGTRTVPGEASTRWVVYLDPGSATVSASFFGNTSATAPVEARAGGSTELRLEPAEAAGGSPPPPSAPPAGPPGATAGPADALPPDPPPPDRGGRSGLPPAVFIGGLVATAAVAGVTVWSGIDTTNNPGADAVRAACAGKGTSCPEYQDGLASQTRTNVLLAATAGTAVLTGVIGAFFTDWGGPDGPPATGFVPAGAVVPGGGAVFARGRF